MNLKIDEFQLVLNFKRVARLQGNMVGLFSIPGAETLWLFWIKEEE